MKLYWRLGWRNIWRSKRRSAITISALAFSVAVLVFFLGIMESYMRQMQDNVVSMTVGHLQIHHPLYRTDQNLYEVVEGSGELVRKLDEAGFSAAARAFGFGLLASEKSGKSAGVRMEAYSLEEEPEVTELHLQKHLLAGRFLSGKTRTISFENEEAGGNTDEEAFADPLADPLGEDESSEPPQTLKVGEIVLGKKLATQLDAAPGDVLSVVVMAADGTLGNELFDVVGVYKNFSEVEDRTLGLVTWDDYQRLFHLGAEEAHEIVVRIPDRMELTAAKTKIEAIVGDAGKTETWREILPAQAEMIDVSRKATPIYAMTVYIGAALVVMNAMLMMVFERIRELGVMKAVGFKGRQIVALIYFETFWMCVLSAAAGTAVGVPLTLWLGHRGMDLSVFAPDGFAISGSVIDPVLYADLTPQALALPLVSLFLISFLSVLYPAVKAAVIEPVKAIYHV